jgi:hypothetical protein
LLSQFLLIEGNQVYDYLYNVRLDRIELLRVVIIEHFSQ